MFLTCLCQVLLNTTCKYTLWFNQPYYIIVVFVLVEGLETTSTLLDAKLFDAFH